MSYELHRDSPARGDSAADEEGEAMKNAKKTDVAGLRKMALWERGMSGLTIVSVLVPSLYDLCEGASGGLGNYPLDPNDFDRCYRYLKMIRDGRNRVRLVAKKYPAWTRLVNNWEELSALYEEERPAGIAPKLYKRMQELTK